MRQLVNTTEGMKRRYERPPLAKIHTVASAQGRREEVAQHVAAFLAVGGMIKCYNNRNQLIGYKTSDHGGEPDLVATGDENTYGIFEIYEFKGELVSTISTGPDGYTVLNHRTNRRSGAVLEASRARIIAKRHVHQFKAMSNRRN